MTEKDELSESNSGCYTYVQEELFAKRIILIDRDIDEESSAELIAKITLLDLKGAKHKKPIIILINSYGGDPHCSLSIADIMASCVCPIITMCIGVAISGGSIILGAGTRRYSTPNSSIMIHQQHLDLGAKNHTELLNEVEVSKVLFKQLENYYMNVMNQPRTKVKKLLQKDSYLTAANALELGLIDGVGWNIHEWVTK